VKKKRKERGKGLLPSLAQDELLEKKKGCSQTALNSLFSGQQPDRKKKRKEGKGGE